MTQQQPTRASPTGFTSLKEWVLYAVGWHLEKKGVARAYEKLENMASVCSFMDGWSEAERAATDMIEQYKRNLNIRTEEREQRNLSSMMAAMMSVAQQTATRQTAPDKAADADTTLLEGADLSDGHIRHCLELLMKERYNGTDELLFNKKSHWQGVFRLLSDAGMYGSDDFDFFDLLMKRVMPRKVNAPYSRASVKNISQTLFNKPFIRWHYDPGLMKRREPYDRMVAIVKRFTELLTMP